MGKRMYDMDENELEAFITEQESKVEKLNYEKPGSVELSLESGVLQDARQLLVEKRRQKAC